MKSAEEESSGNAETYTESFWNLWELPIVIVAATFVIGAIVRLIWCICAVLRDPLPPSITNHSSSFLPNSGAFNTVSGTRPSSITIGRVNGLQNLGNTCYFNAAIQCLGQTAILRRKLLDESLITGDLTKQFTKLLNEMSRESDWPLIPEDLHARFCSKAPKFRGYRQHDSHEFLRNFLDELRRDETVRYALEPSLGRTPKVIDQIFGGHQITVYKCDRCHTPYHVCEPLLDISLPVRTARINIFTGSPPVTSIVSEDLYRKAVKQMMTPLSASKLKPIPGPNPIENKRTAKQRSINDSLEYFTRVEHIKDEYLCLDCLGKHQEEGNQDLLKTSATKQTLIFNPPAILTIHLKRFELTPGRSKKVNDVVKFDELLDIGPYCSSWCKRNDPPSQNLWYSLYGVVVHQSELLTSGHYIAFVNVREKEEQGFEKFLQKQYFDRDITAEQLVEMMEQMQNHPTARWQGMNSKGVWYLVNDLHVCKVTLETVLKQEAYLLFYDRLQYIPDTVLPML